MPSRNPETARPIGHSSHRNRAASLLPAIEWDWSFAEDGALALDRSLQRHDADQPVLRDISAAPEQPDPLQVEPRTATVPPVRSPRPSRQARLDRARRARARKRARRIAGGVILAVVLVVTLLLTAFGSDRPAPVKASAPAPAVRLLPAGPPSPQVIALQGSLRIQLPVPQERLTAIGVYGSGDGALQLSPLGTKGNQGFLARSFHRVFGGGGAHGSLRYYALGGPGRGYTALDVGAPAGTDVYAPVDGSVVGLTPLVIDGRAVAAQIDIQPISNPAVVVSVTQVKPDPSLRVGASLGAATSKIGTIVDLSKIEQQALARYTQDLGNHATIEVHPAATLPIP